MKIVLIAFVLFQTIAVIYSDEPIEEPPENGATYDGSTNSTDSVEISVVPEVTAATNETVGGNQTKYVACLPDQGALDVQLMNDTEVMKLILPAGNVTSKETLAKCVIVLFYSQQCPFSCMAAPHFNALSRAFPDIKMAAINAMAYNINTQNGVGGVPTLILFHNGRIIAKYNESDYSLELFSKFITRWTGIEQRDKSFVTSADFAGPVSSVLVKTTDYYLSLSWSFIVVCGWYWFMKSKWFTWLVESIKRNWRDSEATANHEHVD